MRESILLRAAWLLWVSARCGCEVACNLRCLRGTYHHGTVPGASTPRGGIELKPRGNAPRLSLCTPSPG
eukprot:2986934-Prymnesium_polylepis.1